MTVIPVTLNWRLGTGRTGALLETNFEVSPPVPTKNFLPTVGTLQCVGRAVKLRQLLVLRGTWLWLLFCGVGLQGSGMSLAIGQSLLDFLGSSLPTGHLRTMGVPSGHSEQDQRI